jgi:triosephosphate isomerase (TIM)
MKLTRPLVFGNWKMNGLLADGQTRLAALALRFAAEPVAGTLAVFPPATLLAVLAPELRATPILLGGQDCHVAASGAHTGDVSAAMLADCGCALVLVGHSERRQGHGETDALVRAKAEAALAAGLVPVVCIGETLAEREAGDTLARLESQLEGSLPAGADGDRVVVAYEPVWAIGSGRTPSAEEIVAAHGFMRGWLTDRVAGGDSLPLLYGGSVKADNAAGILALRDVDGALVGGASLKAEDFWSIFTAGARAMAGPGARDA